MGWQESDGIAHTQDAVGMETNFLLLLRRAGKASWRSNFTFRYTYFSKLSPKLHKTVMLKFLDCKLCAVKLCCLVDKSVGLFVTPGTSLLGSSVHGISLARILGWVAVFIFRASSPPRFWSHISCLADRFFTTEPPAKPAVKMRGPQRSFVYLSFIYGHWCQQISTKLENIFFMYQKSLFSHLILNLWLQVICHNFENKMSHCLHSLEVFSHKITPYFHSKIRELGWKGIKELHWW